MKKLLLVLFISLGLIGSANANSINGAFGYKFGQVLKNTKLENVYGTYISSKYFKPVRPLPYFSKYNVSTTLNDKKIYSIEAWHSDDSSSSNSCELDYGDFPKMLKMLEAKYGNFEETINTSKYGYNNDGEPWFIDKIGFEYIKNNRSISLICERDSNWSYRLSIFYFDKKLANIKNKENKAWQKQKALKEKQNALEEASDYDI